MKFSKKVSAVILAAGDGIRFGENKIFVNIDSTPLIVKTLRPFIACQMIDEIVICVKREDKKKVEELFSCEKKAIQVVEGGNSRHQSSFIGINSTDSDYVLIHDGARCNVSVLLIERIIEALDSSSGVIPTVPLTDSVIENKGNGIKYLNRDDINRIQTPQGFPRQKLIEVYSELMIKQQCDIEKYTDNGSVWATAYQLKLVDGDNGNIKVTYPEDIKHSQNIRVGNGYDLHRLVGGRSLVLGGIEIPHDKGLLGHSDADCVLHALMDALLSSVSLPDIGNQFPDTDPSFKDINSTILLEKTMKLLEQKQAKPISVSLTILAEKPKLSPFVPRMKEKISKLLGLGSEKIGITATTTEGIGTIGREEGIACYASALIECFDS